MYCYSSNVFENSFQRKVIYSLTKSGFQFKDGMDYKEKTKHDSDNEDLLNFTVKLNNRSIILRHSIYNNDVFMPCWHVFLFNLGF